MAEWLAQWIPSDRSGRALELGAGPGLFTRHLLPWRGALTASDLSGSMCSAGRMSVPGVAWEEMPAEAPTGGPWDWIFSSSMLQWVADPREVFAAWHACWLPGGRVLAGLFVEGSLPELGALAGEPAPLTWRKPAEWSEAFARRPASPSSGTSPSAAAISHPILPWIFCARSIRWAPPRCAGRPRPGSAACCTTMKGATGASYRVGPPRPGVRGQLGALPLQRPGWRNWLPFRIFPLSLTLCRSSSLSRSLLRNPLVGPHARPGRAGHRRRTRPSPGGDRRHRRPRPEYSHLSEYVSRSGGCDRGIESGLVESLPLAIGRRLGAIARGLQCDAAQGLGLLRQDTAQWRIVAPGEADGRLSRGRGPDRRPSPISR